MSALYQLGTEATRKFPHWETSDGRVLLVCADCLDVLPTLAAGSVDAVVTDPPYGIGFKYESHDDSEDQWFVLMDMVVPLCRKVAQFVVMPSCAVKRLPWWYEHHQPDWIIAWHKGSPGHQSAIGFNDWEPHVVWGRPSHPMHDYFSTACGFDDNGHPCPKPLAYSRWLVSRAAIANETILDPFMGSGTTGVACVRLGRKFLGVEKEPKYFEIAKRRIIAELERMPLFEDKPTYRQSELIGANP